MTNLISFLQYIGLSSKNRKNTQELSTGVRTSITKIRQDAEQTEIYLPIEPDEPGNAIDDMNSPCFRPFIPESEVNRFSMEPIKAMDENHL